jgi:hypothetical protein
MFKKAVIDKQATLQSILDHIQGNPIMECLDQEKFEQKSQDPEFLKKVAEAFSLAVDYLPDPDIKILGLNWGRLIPVNISDQACHQFGFKHGDKIVDNTHPNPDYKHPNIVMGVAYGTDPDSIQTEVLWFESTHPSSQGKYFYIRPENIKNYEKVS